ncbi:MAG: LacI family DNA-binding transcriptional regulator [Clostridia bacterium]|nr:LacI family DNA-binding transcriptional regulator [Clostridia bacterium]
MSNNKSCSSKITSTDVAREAGVSQTTVSLILSNSGRSTFSQETRDRVLQAAEKLHYRIPERRKKAPAVNNRTLLVLIPTVMNEYYATLISILEEYAQSLNYHIFVCNCFRKPELEKFYLDTFAGTAACGIIYTFLPGFPELVEEINKTIPTVIIGEKHPDMSICSVELNNITAGSMLADYLLKAGHRKLVFISTPLNRLSLSRSQRLEGIQKRLESEHVTDGLTILSADSLSENDKLEDGMPYEYSIGRMLTAQLIREGTDATALIGVNDMTAIGIMNMLAELGVKVPKDFSVCGFDNIFSSNITTPGLTTVDHHLRLRCESAVDMVVSMLEPDGSGHPFLRKIEYAPQLIIRGSTGPVNSHRVRK